MTSASPVPPVLGGGELIGLLWRSPLAAMLQDAHGLLVDANDAYAEFTGQPRERMLGRDPLEWQPQEDRELYRSQRDQLLQRLRAGQAVPPLERRLIDSRGRERWFRASVYALPSTAGEPLVLSLLQDSTAEHEARAQAERSMAELAHWFELSPAGMLLYDDAGLIVRSNPAVEALLGRVPVALPEASADLQRLLGWPAGGAADGLRPGALPRQTTIDVQRPDGSERRLTARLRAYDTETGQHRVMAVVEDRSAEDERDLAQLEIGALMNAAGIGVATFDSQRGWRRSTAPAPLADRPLDEAPREAAGAALQAIHREMVDPASRAEYEKLQRALRSGERVQVRYAVRHPELGLRWLLTRAEPTPLGGGVATSVVTLDVTEQEVAQRRNEELLRELTTILDGSPAGIAYLRDSTLVRCNRRFERMLGFAPGAVAGAGFDELFRNRPAARDALGAAAVAQALAAGKGFDAEFDAVAPDGNRSWYSLAVRRAEVRAGGTESVAVLTDITRLKAAQAELEALLHERDLMFSLSEVGIVWLRGRRIERANQAMASLTGFAPAELAALDITELHSTAEAGAAWEDAALRVLQTQARFSAERLLRRRDGSLRWVQVAMRSADPADPRAGVVCSFVDIDDRQRARETLQQQAGRTRSMLDSVQVGIVTVGEQGIEWMNRSARRMFAGELGEFAGEPIGTVATDDPAHPLRRTDWLARLSDGQAETFECRLKARDGREFWVVGNAVATSRDGDRGVGGRQVTFALLDIEVRRRAEVRIARAQASLQRVIETAPLAIALFDADTQRVQQLNQMAAAFFGRPIAELLGRSPAQWADWLGADEAGALKASLTLAGESADGVRREITHGAGALARLWDTRFVSLPASEGGSGQVLVVASDVTEQRVAEQARLEAAIAQREMLVKEVHHRIKNNLQGVAGLLQQTAARHPEVSGVLTDAVGQVQTIAQVYGLQVGSGGPVALAGLLAAIAGSVQRTFGRTIAVDTDAATWQLPEAESIPVALTVNELLTNAIKHGDGNAVACALRDTEGGAGGVTIEVANHGRLREGFDLARVPSGVYGLGLVRALLPRRSSTFAILEQGDRVVARVTLAPPSVVRPVAAP